MLKLIEKLFKERAREFLAKDFDKHVNYLRNTIFSRSDYNFAAFNQAIALCQTDMNAGVDDLYNVLQTAISEFHDKQCEKARKLAQKVNMADCGNGIIEVGSENGNGTYKVNLLKHECGCQYFRRICYAGLLCKHYVAARERFGDTYPIEPATEDPSPTSKCPNQRT